MTCKRNGAVTVAWRLLVRYSVRYSVGSTLIERVLRFRWEKGCFAAPWVELLLVRRLLSESQSSSSERRRKHGTPKMNSWRFFEGSSTSALVRRQRPAPGQVMLHQQQREQAASFLLACQWPKIVQPRTGWRHARQQPDFLLLFGTCGDSLSGTTTGDGAAKWIKTIVLSSPFSSTSYRRTALKLGTTDLRGLRNTLVQKKLEIYLRQKSRFWSVHACLKLNIFFCSLQWVEKVIAQMIPSSSPRHGSLFVTVCMDDRTP